MTGPAPLETADPGEASFDDSQVGEAAAYLKTLSHQGRLLILCHLCKGELSVSELESLLDIRQAAVSQMLARLRDENLVTTRRNGKTVYYALADHRTEQVIGLLHSLFCES
ncbi:ArsR/SmtB family transcription factor [Heliomarina baculiformis]|uniref:ArsR/SmtB family transcription factor n=1 Tax=Heliomarina baculiformis TaxID=2872036 RepID=UPI001EE18B76